LPTCRRDHLYEALGTIDERWEDNGTLVGVMPRAGKSQIGLNQDDWKKGRDRKKGIGQELAHLDAAERRRVRNTMPSRCSSPETSG
jgi:hypothetical protein